MKNILSLRLLAPLSILALAGCHRAHAEEHVVRPKYAATNPLRQDTKLTKEFVAQVRAIRPALPDAVDWARWEAAGEQRRGEVRRLELVRHGFRRALQVWLVMDLALGLEEAGFEVAVGTFCDRALTPRNLMVLAERRSGG